MNQCPLCGKEDFTFTYKQLDQYPDADIVRCNQCGHPVQRPAQSWQSGIAGGNWIHLGVPRHIHHFTPERLEQFAREIGFKPVKKTFFSFHLEVLGMVDSLLKLLGYKKKYYLRTKE